MGNYQELLVWQRAMDVAVSIHGLFEHGELARDYVLRNQIWKSALSVPSNIAEGDDKDTARFFNIAKASIAELQTQLILANRIGYLNKTKCSDLVRETNELSKMILALIRARRRG